MEGIVALALLIILLLPLGLIILFRRGLRLSRERARSIAYSAKSKDPKYIAEQEERKKKEEQFIRELHKKWETDPDVDIASISDKAMEIHMDRLRKFGRSKHLGDMYYVGSRGGIYTISSNGTRNYKYWQSL